MRCVPLFPEITGLLQQAFDEAEAVANVFSRSVTDAHHDHSTATTTPVGTRPSARTSTHSPTSI